MAVCRVNNAAARADSSASENMPVRIVRERAARGNAYPVVRSDPDCVRSVRDRAKRWNTKMRLEIS